MEHNIQFYFGEDNLGDNLKNITLSGNNTIDRIVNEIANKNTSENNNYTSFR